MKTKFDRIRDEAVEQVEHRMKKLEDLRWTLVNTDKLFMDDNSISEFLDRLSKMHETITDLFDPTPDQRKSISSIQQITEFYIALSDLMESTNEKN